MPFRRGGFSRRRGILPMVHSIKNEVNTVNGLTAGANNTTVIAVAVDSPASATANNVRQGSSIKAIWFEFWYYGLTGANVNDILDMYMMKNPGANLTPPNPGTVGTSNEKKFVIREWKGLAGTKTTGGTPYSRSGGWIKIPRRYHRMGTDDTWLLVARSPTTGNLCLKFIYKWYY